MIMWIMMLLKRYWKIIGKYTEVLRGAETALQRRMYQIADPNNIIEFESYKRQKAI
jgi:hypothetical protein